MGAGLLLLALVPAAPAQTALEWKFKEGDKFFIEAVTETKQTVTLADKPTTSASTYTTVSSFVVKKAEAGSYTLDQTIEGVQVKSAKADDSTVAIASRFANLLKGAKFTFTINSAGKLTSKLDGYDDFIRRLSGGSDKIEKDNRAFLPEDALKDELSAIFGFLPGKSVEKDDTWKRTETLALPWGKLTGETTYKYGGKDKDGEKIDITQKWSYALPDEGAGGVKVSKGDVKVTDATGTIVADLAAGRLVSHKETRHLTGHLTTTDAAKKETPFDIDQTTTRTIRRVEENPLK